MKTLEDNFFTIQEACELLAVSRPTLNAYRKKYEIREVKHRGRVLLNKLDVLQKTYLSDEEVSSVLTFIVSTEFTVEDCEVAPDVFDIRTIKTIDSFGAICLLCCLKDRVKHNRRIYLLTGNNSASVYLQQIRFFTELRRVDSHKVQVDDSVLSELDVHPTDVILPFHLIGYKGKEKAILEELYTPLKHQGFSEELCSILGWVLGELADNATLHSAGPCYFMLSSDMKKLKCLTLTIGDVGVGIPANIRSKDKYKSLSDLQAFVTAFKSNVTSWDDVHNRGRGLNDILGVAMGNHSRVRAESNGLSLRFDFETDQAQVDIIHPGTQTTGSRYSVVLIDSEFSGITKKQVDVVIDNVLRDL